MNHKTKKILTVSLGTLGLWKIVDFVSASIQKEIQKVSFDFISSKVKVKLDTKNFQSIKLLVNAALTFSYQNDSIFNVPVENVKGIFFYNNNRIGSFATANFEMLPKTKGEIVIDNSFSISSAVLIKELSSMKIKALQVRYSATIKGVEFNELVTIKINASYE